MHPQPGNALSHISIRCSRRRSISDRRAGRCSRARLREPRDSTHPIAGQHTLGGIMRKRFVTRRSLVPLLALLCAGSAAAQSGTATVTGLVSDSLTKTPIAGAEVILSADAAASPARTTRTNVSGHYTFTGVAAGATVVSVRMVGFAPKAQRLT